MNNWMVALATLLLAACSGGDPDRLAVREAFEQYRVSLIDRDGEAAVALISGSTLEYYDGLRDLALCGEPDALARATLIDRLAVYKYRAEWSGAELERLSAEDTFVYAVDQGWVGSNLGSLDITSIRVFGDSATTNLSAGGERVPWGFTFHREEGAWRIDLASLMTIMNVAMAQQIEQLGMTELEFAEFFLTSTGYSGGADERILNPLLAADPD